MITLSADLSNLNDYLTALITEHKVVGASLAVLHNDQRHQAAAGRLNITTGVNATCDSLFQIGSISKVFTATLVMQLVDEGNVNLDTPVKNYLPDFKIADHHATHTITVRQLLNHTSGMEGDFFPEDDTSGPSTHSYIRKCHCLPQLHPVGDYLSYCNSAYVWLGWLIETLDRKPWAQSVMARLIEPLDMQHCFVDPAESLRFRVAMGHTADPVTGEPVLANRCYLPLSTGPLGSRLTMSAKDLLTFGRLHLENGQSSSGKTILSAQSTSAMQAVNTVLPELSWRRLTGWGLGWFSHKSPSDPGYYYGHDGATRGQFSYLRIYPNSNTVVALLTNSASRSLFQALEQSLDQALGFTPFNDRQTPSTPPTDKIDPQHYIGRYQNIGALVDVSVEHGQLVRRTISRIDAVLNREEQLTYQGEHRFSGTVDGDALFLDVKNGRAANYMYCGFRLFSRCND